MTSRKLKYQVALTMTVDKDAVFVKDSIYWALSLAYHHISDQLPFSFIFKNGMFQDLSNADPK